MLIAKPAMPMPIQKRSQARPRADHWPNGKLPRRPARHSKHLGSADQGGCTRRRKVLGGDINCTHSANTPPAPCKNLPTLAKSLLPVANSSAPTPTTAAAIGRTRLGPRRSIAAPATRLNGEYP